MTIDLQQCRVFILGLALILAGCEQAKPPIPTSKKTESDSDTVAKPKENDANGDNAAEPTPVAAVDSAATKGKPSNKVTLGSPELTAGIPGSGPLKMEELKAWLDAPKNLEVLEVELPLGLDAGAGQLKGLEENPLTRAKIELGR